MATFVLIPGAWHGAWSWDRVAPLIIAAGHEVVAVDLPCEDVAVGCAGYRDVVLDAVAGLSGELIVVGHSAGGLTAPLVAGSLPSVRSIILLSALLPSPGESFFDQNERESILLSGYQAGIETDDGGCRRWFDRDICARTMYSGCEPADVDWAFRHLRPQASTMYSEVSPLESWPAIPVTDVRGDVDQLVSPVWAQRAVPARLGVDSQIIRGAGHSSMLSHPAEVAQIMLAAAS